MNDATIGLGGALAMFALTVLFCYLASLLPL